MNGLIMRGALNDNARPVGRGAHKPAASTQSVHPLREKQ
jgi:hypothetical protein